MFLEPTQYLIQVQLCNICSSGGHLILPKCAIFKNIVLIQVLEMAVLDLPGLLFFSTYTLLVLFWAEIYHQVP